MDVVITKATEIISTMNLDKQLYKTLERISSSMLDIFPIRKLIVYLYDETEKAFAIVSSHGFAAEQEEDLLSITYSRDQFARRLRSGRCVGRLSVIHRPKARAEAKGKRAVKPRRQPRSVAGSASLDWKRGDRLEIAIYDRFSEPVGSFEMLDMEKNAVLTQEMVCRMELFVSLASLAIELAFLRDAQQKLSSEDIQRATQLSELLSLSNRFLRTRDLDELAKVIVDEISQLFEMRSALLIYRKKKGGGYIPLANRKLKLRKDEERTLARLDISSSGLQELIDTGQRIGSSTFLLPIDPLNKVLGRQLFETDGPNRRGTERIIVGELSDKALAIVMSTGTGIAGVVLGQMEDVERPPKPETVEMMELFASSATVALENSLLFVKG